MLSVELGLRPWVSCWLSVR